MTLEDARVQQGLLIPPTHRNVETGGAKGGTRVDLDGDQLNPERRERLTH